METVTLNSPASKPGPPSPRRIASRLSQIQGATSLSKISCPSTNEHEVLSEYFAYKAPRHNAPEQKMWIQCTLNGAKQRGEDWIESNFSDDETVGCSSCLPDIVIVNDPEEISKDQDSSASKAPATWQRILTQEQAKTRIEKYPLDDHCCAPTAVCTMSNSQSASTSVPDTYLYDHERSCVKLQRFCAKIYMSRCFKALFRGNESSAKFSNVEPAQNFRCGLKNFLQERAVLFFVSVVFFWALAIFFQSIYIRFAYAIFWGTVDFDRINTFKVTCAGCKIQIINDKSWAGFFEPSNVIMYFPLSNEVEPIAQHDNGRLLQIGIGGFPSFCSEQTKSCDLVIRNFQNLPAANSSIYHKRLFSDDTVDLDFYYYPTIDLIIPSNWTGQLVIHSGALSSEFPHPTVILPFKKPAFGWLTSLYPQSSLDISVPSLHLHSEYGHYPIFFNGVRGGQYRNVTVRCVTGAFVARGAEFMPGSVVDVTMPMGDIIISANQKIETTVSSIYSATPPFVEEVFTSASLPKAILFITLIGTNFRNIFLDDLNLNVPNGTCNIHTPSSMPGLATRVNVTFFCDFSSGIQNSGPVAGPILLSYFGGNIKTTGFDLIFLAAAGASASLSSPSVNRRAAAQFPSGKGCADEPQVLPGNVCAVAAAGSQKVPPFSVATANNAVTMIPSHKSTRSNSFKFISHAARSLTLGSFLYQTPTNHDENINMQDIAACPIFYKEDNPATHGRIANMNPNYHIPYQEQQKLQNAIQALKQDNVSFIIIKTKGGGTNLPGYFTLTKRKIYTVIDPTIIQTLTFGLLPIPTLAVDVSFGVGLCPDLSSSVDFRDDGMIQDYVWPRIAQNYEILWNFLTYTYEEADAMQLSFQFKLPIQIVKAGFSTVVVTGTETQQRMGFMVDSGQNFGWDRESVLLGISVLFPYLCSFVISFIILKLVLEMIFEYRKTLFLSTIEGERLSRIEPFSDLAQVPHALHNHISDLVRLAPASAHLQSKFKADLLKIISHFEIKEREAMPEHIQWACKVRPTPSNYVIDIKNYIRQTFTRAGSDFTRLPQSDDSNSDVLEDSGVQERFKCYMFKSFEKKYERKVGFAQVLDILENISNPIGNEFKKQKLIADVIKDRDRIAIFSVPSNEETKKIIFEYVVVISSSFPCDPRIRYCIKNVIESKKEGLFKFDLVSLDKCQRLVLAEDVKTIELSFEDPYKIDDDFINFVFSSNALNPNNNSLVASVKRVQAALEKSVKKNSKEHRKIFGNGRIMPINLHNDGTLDWSPFKDRIILTVAAIFCESVESYRTIVASTGIEGFFDMLLVNGSLNLSKWKIIGTIDQIMDEFHHKKSSKSDGTGDSRIPAFCSEDMSTIAFRQSVIEGKLKKMQNSSSGFHTDCTLHGPASSSKNVVQNRSEEVFVRSTASNGGLPKSIKMISKANGTVSKAKEWFTDAKHRYEEDIEWRPFQPGCSFDIDTNSQTQGKTGGDSLETNMNAAEQKNLELGPGVLFFDDVRFTFFGKPNYKPEANKSKKCTKIEMVDDDENSLAGNPNCHLHVQCFQALQQKVEAMCADEFEFSNSSSALYSHQLLHAYKPRGILNASLSALMHSCFCGFAVCPTLFFFVFWAYNNVNAYLIHPYWTPAAYVIIYVAIFAGISVAYLLAVYLEFPFIFYGKSLISEDINYFCFKPFIGVWLPNLRRLFYSVLVVVIIFDVASIVLFLIWLALGVVVQPALAIPYFTGVVTFVGNIISLSRTLRNWQETIMDKVLEQLQTFIDPLKPQLLDVLEAIMEKCALQEGSPFTGISSEKLALVRKKLGDLYCSIEVNNFEAPTTDGVTAAQGPHWHQVAPNAAMTAPSGETSTLLKDLKARQTEATRLRSLGISAASVAFRKPSEPEIVALLSSVWSSIREELGLSTRNIVAALLGSSIILFFFLLFIFIGIGIFSDATDPFAAVVNAGLTIFAGLGVNQRNRTPNEAEGAAALEAVASKFLMILQSRLKKTKTIIIQIFVVMMSTEAESAEIIATIQEMKFGLEGL